MTVNIEQLVVSRLLADSVIRNFRITAILCDAWCVTAELAKAFTESEFEKYRIVQDMLFKSDFDRFISGLENKGGENE